MKKPINPLFPVVEVDTPDQLMDVAMAMEHEAARRYEELAAEMERQGNAETAALFLELADEEREHESEIAAWGRRADGREPQPVEFQWRMPETFELGKTSSYTLTPYRALSIAVRNEECAFAFYSYLAAIAEKTDLRERAEDFARGELNHVRRLRARRREAYHAERRDKPRRVAAASLSQLHSLAAGLERTSAELNARLAEILEAAHQAASASILRRIAEEQRHTADNLGNQVGAEVEGSPTAEAARTAGILEPGGLTTQGTLRLGIKNAEEMVQTYLDIAEQTRDEQVMREAQRLGEQAIAQLTLIHSQAPE